MTPLGLAYWICDDGSLSGGRTLTKHVNAFSENEVIQLSNELNRKFNLNSYPKEKGNYFVIRIPAKDANRIRELIANLMPKSMYHKIPKGHNK